MLRDADIQLTCRQCGRQFVFTKGEQEFYDLKGFTAPSHCRECRTSTKNQSHHLVCSECGIEVEKEESIYCNACLKRLKLEFEREIRKVQKAASMASTKLQVAESHKAELEESLCQTKQLVAELELRVNNLILDLETAYRFYVASGWLQPALNSVEQRLEALEQAQRESNQKILDMIRTMQEEYESVGLLEIIKRSLTPYRRQSAYSKVDELSSAGATRRVHEHRC